MLPYLLAAVGGYLIGNSLKSEKFASGGEVDKSAKDQVQDLVQNMSAKKYKDFAYDYDIDHRDAMEMQDFLSSLSDAEAKAILKKYGK